MQEVYILSLNIHLPFKIPLIKEYFQKLGVLIKTLLFQFYGQYLKLMPTKKRLRFVTRVFHFSFKCWRVWLSCREASLIVRCRPEMSRLGFYRLVLKKIYKLLYFSFAIFGSCNVLFYHVDQNAVVMIDEFESCVLIIYV